MAPDNVILASQALLFQPRIQRIKALKARCRNHEVTPPISDTTFNMPLIIPLGRAAKLIVEHVKGLQFGECPGPFAGPIAANLGNCDLCI